MSLEERLDTSSAAGELVFHVFGAIAHFERRLISERTRDGIAAARKRGRPPGRPRLDPETVSAAQKLIEAGLSPARADRAHEQGLTRRERRFMRESAPTFNDLRTPEASGPLLEVGSSRNALRRGSTPAPAQASPPAR